MPVSDAAWESLKGGYDLQVHVAPDVIERRIDDLDLSKEFLARGLRGFVLKSHYFPTAERAKVVTRAVPGITGLAQLKNGYDNSAKSAATKAEFDLHYIRNASVLFDLQIMTATVPHLLLGKGDPRAQRTEVSREVLD